MPDGRILVVDDEKSMREFLAIMLKKEGYDVLSVDGGDAALEAIRRERVDLMITDVRMPRMDGLTLVRAVKDVAPSVVILVITAFSSTDTAVEAMKLGAYDYIEKPFKLDEIKLTVAKAIERKRLGEVTEALTEENLLLKRELETRRRSETIVGKSRRIQEVFETVRKIADSHATVMITGESGTGKELIARAVHQQSHRRERPFVSVNCGAIPDGLIESELFGHVKGAFTGAVANKVGLFAAADGGTLFLDEIAEVPQGLQVKLLRAIQEREVRRVGDTRDVKVDVRVIGASNRDLEAAVRDNILREDLFYRLNVIPIHLPPLRERREDIPLLVDHFLQKFAKELGKEMRRVSPEAMALLEHHHWGGNIRELENVIERAVVLGGSEILGPDALPDAVRRPRPIREVEPDFPDEGLEGRLERIEQQYLQMALERAGGVQTRAAELLGMTFRQFRYKVHKYGLGRRGERPLTGQPFTQP
jgi:two-component system response regulator PilR (NtrC family)